MSVKLISPGGGSVTIADPASTASNFTLNPPLQNGTLVATDASGNVGIGVTPSAWASGKPAIEIPNGSAFWSFATGSNFLTLNAYYNGSNWVYKQSNYASYYSQNGGQHQWWTAASGTAGNTISFTQAMTLDSSGNLLVGATSSATTAKFYVTQTSANGYTQVVNALNNGGTRYLVQWQADGSAVGSVTSNGTTTTYGTSSDYRLKENVAPMTGALSVVSQLKPCTYKWKTDGSDGQGFIAHELQAVVPDCVTGEKDAVDADGNPVYQGIDTSFLVATLTAAIQEQQVIIADLKARIETLEDK